MSSTKNMVVRRRFDSDERTDLKEKPIALFLCDIFGIAIVRDPTTSVVSFYMLFEDDEFWYSNASTIGKHSVYWLQNFHCVFKEVENWKKKYCRRQKDGQYAYFGR